VRSWLPWLRPAMNTPTPIRTAASAISTHAQAGSPPPLDSLLVVVGETSWVVWFATEVVSVEVFVSVRVLRSTDVDVTVEVNRSVVVLVVVSGVVAAVPLVVGSPPLPVILASTTEATLDADC
jgi:hypothetical protein